MTIQPTLTPTDIFAAASSLLEAGGYRRIDRPLGQTGSLSGARLFEDAYSIVAVLVYEVWSALSAGWPEAQGALVELISGAVTSAEPKAWEGYLALFTPGELGPDARAEATEIRYNTARVRKLVAAGEELRILADVERALLPLLPLAAGSELGEPLPMLDLLPRLLARHGIPENAVRALAAAFQEQRPLLDSLHQYLRDQDGTP